MAMNSGADGSAEQRTASHSARAPFTFDGKVIFSRSVRLLPSTDSVPAASSRWPDKITETPSPSHPIARGRTGPQLLAEVLFAKYRAHPEKVSMRLRRSTQIDALYAHLPLNRQSDIYAKERVDLDVSTLAGWVGAAAATLSPLVDEIKKHVLGAERIHADDTTVPVLAKGKCTTGRLWTYVRDDRPFGGEAAPAALFYYSPDRAGQHPENHLADYSGIMQADAYSGYNGLYAEGRKPGPIFEAACWAHGRRKFFELADLQKAPIAIEAVRRIDELFAIEREINGRSSSYRHEVRQARSRPLVEALEEWLRTERRKLSSKSPVAKAIDYSLKRWRAFTCFLEDGRICLSNNAAERALRGDRGWQAQLDLLRLRQGSSARSRHLHADRDLQTKRCRPAGMACRHPGPHRRSSSKTHWRALALELEDRRRRLESRSINSGSRACGPGRMLTNEGPQGEVRLTTGFWLFDTPVTQELWTTVMGGNPSLFKDPKRPVEHVSWNDAQEFLTRINKLIPDLDLILPTEAQWNKPAVRGRLLQIMRATKRNWATLPGSITTVVAKPNQ